TLHDVEPGEGGDAGPRHWRLIEEAIDEVNGHTKRIVLESGPVVARPADVPVPQASAADHDVVTAFGVELIVFAAADVDVVAGDRVIPERVEVVAGRAVGGAGLEPVVAFVAYILFVGFTAQDEVVAGGAEALRGILAGDDEVVAKAPEEQVEAVAA